MADLLGDCRFVGDMVPGDFCGEVGLEEIMLDFVELLLTGRDDCFSGESDILLDDRDDCFSTLPFWD